MMGMSDFATLLRSPRTVIVDVRTKAEFDWAHMTGSFNIPLEEIPQRLEEFRKMPEIVLCCAASGIRSEQAEQILYNNGIAAHNAGSWEYVNYLKNR